MSDDEEESMPEGCYRREDGIIQCPTRTCYGYGFNDCDVIDKL
jgi:hypothetical protein